ncbi:MAG: TetR/AcrR family transcriptional regulator, partial [Anaerolineae bacterium]
IEAADLDSTKKYKVFEAAKELFGRFGFRKTTVDEIAEKAGISKRTMYSVFSSKEQILAELVLHEALSFRHFCLGELKHRPGPVEKFHLFCALSANYFDENPFLGRVLSDDAHLFAPFLGNEIHVVEEGIKDIIGKLLQEGMEAGVFRPMNLTHAVQCVMVMFRGFTYRRAKWRDGNVEWIDFILRAIASP